MDRRTFIRLVAGSAACSFVGGAVPAGAEELDDNFTPFSPELAAEMASAFFLREPVVYPHVFVPRGKALLCLRLMRELPLRRREQAMLWLFLAMEG